MEKLNKVLNVKIVMCGCLEMGWEVIRHLLDNGIQISYFVTLRPETALQYKVSGYENYKDLADQYSIPVYYAESYSLTSKNDLDFFRTNKFDLLIQGGWQRLFPEDLLKSLRIGAIGIHGSSELLPKGRGRSPINWSLIEGKKRFIFQYFLIKPGIDDGDIFYFETVDINDFDTCRTIYYKNSIVSKRVMLEWIPRLVSGKYVAHQQTGEATYYLKRVPEDGLIDWSKSVFQIYDFVRALTHPYPGAFSFIERKKVEIWRAQPFDTRITYYGKREGEIVELFKTGDFVVNCNGGLLLVTDYDTAIDIKEGMRLTNLT